MAQAPSGGVPSAEALPAKAQAKLPKEPEPEVVAEPNLQLFTVMAAINAAGYDDAANRPEAAPMRAAIRKELAAKNITVLPALREFYQRHRLSDPARELSQYVTLALFMGDPPKFEIESSPSNLPPEIADMGEVVPLMAEFFQQADIPALWNKYQEAMEDEADRYRAFLSKVVIETNGYLRMDSSGFYGRKFAIYINPMGAPSQTNARNYGDHYYVVVGPSAEIPEEVIRHGWLHYMLDPFPYRNVKLLESKSQLQKISERVPNLDPAFKTNFGLVVTESLIRAIQARRMKASQEEKQGMVNEAVETGNYLAAYFFDAMAVFEKQPVGMKLYYSEMIEAIPVTDEERRLAKVQFRAPIVRENNEAVFSSTEMLFRRGEDHIARGQLDEARRLYETLAKDYGPQPKALYQLGIVSALQNYPAIARDYFTQAATQSSDPHIKSWAHIYLGRMLDREGERDAAKVEYTAALEAGDPAPETRAAAQKGLDEAFIPSKVKAETESKEQPRVRVPLGKD